MLVADRWIVGVAVHREPSVSLAGRARTGLLTRRQRAAAIGAVHQDVKRMHPGLRPTDALEAARRHVAKVEKGLR